MSSNCSFATLSRRALLSAFAALPALSTLVPLSATAQAAAAAGDPLPSGNDTETRKAIVAFVERVTKAGLARLVPEAERVATFDNDGTLWAEQPMYFQFPVRCRPRRDFRAASSRVEGQGAVRLAAEGRGNFEVFFGSSISLGRFLLVAPDKSKSNPKLSPIATS